MFLVFMIIWSTALLGGVMTVWALAWAIQRGEFRHFRDGATVIFDEDEPVGMQTDYFPGEGPPQAHILPAALKGAQL
jgi:hypothetical protein